ncbi:MAG: hypothetical protein K2J00_07385 [Bacteroidaceae bacterium]|nr:hypothetical protein [Bacteroidaceae bacterium]
MTEMKFDEVQSMGEALTPEEMKEIFGGFRLGDEPDDGSGSGSGSDDGSDPDDGEDPVDPVDPDKPVNPYTYPCHCGVHQTDGTVTYYDFDTTDAEACRTECAMLCAEENKNCTGAYPD